MTCKKVKPRKIHLNQSGVSKARTAAGRAQKEIIRLLKRAIAREILRYLTTPVAVPGIADLRPARQANDLVHDRRRRYIRAGQRLGRCEGASR
ncbi:hypothetical protein ACFW9O_33745 [Streptomyces sp. NPDC059499]|uniref:hypothetical protein n=1 Tax=Streptomyces sp. NPDC059499 TaxID=3346852 RepID=UPI0036B80C0C